MNKLRGSSAAATIVWGVVILATAIVLKDTPYLTQMLLILGGARRGEEER